MCEKYVQPKNKLKLKNIISIHIFFFMGELKKDFNFQYFSLDTSA